MPRGASTVYEVSMPSRRLTISRMRFNDEMFEKAKTGSKNHQDSIAIAFGKMVKKNYGVDPGWVDYKLLRFTALAAVPAQP